MTDRDRLADIIDSFFGCDSAYFDIDKYELADHLLANGAIIPPCKIGDMVHRLTMSLHTKRIAIKETEVERIAICSDKVQVYCKGYAHSPAIFGKTVFLTKEEAEQALKEREQSDR